MSTTYITGPTDTYLTAIITHPDTANACYGGGCATPACHCTGAPKYQSNRFVLPHVTPPPSKRFHRRYCTPPSQVAVGQIRH